MKFEGSLDAFSLPDIFQLLSFTKKSGGLRLRHGRSEGVVWFVDGFVTGATSDVAHQALARRMAGLGLVGPDALRAAVEESTRTEGGTGVARALFESGAVDPDVVRTTVSAQAIDAVSELLRWPTGDFTLVEGANPDDVGVLIASDSIVAEAVARSTAWEDLAEVLPSPDVVLVLRPIGSDQDTVLKPEEWSLLALVDGRRTVGSIVALTGRGQFAVVSTLAELVRRGLLAPRGTQDPVADLESALALLAPLESGSGAGFEEDTDTWSSPARVQPPVSEEASVQPVKAAPGPFATTPPSPVTAPPETASLTLALSAVDDESVDESAADDQADGEADDDIEVAVGVLPRLGGAHVPGDVVPPRAEPFLPSRQPDHPEAVPPIAARLTGLPSVGGGTQGSAAMAADPQAALLIERDPSVNRSLLLRLIAGVRGL